MGTHGLPGRPSRTVLTERAEIPLGDGQARLAVRRVGLTANNVTYAVLGESFRYWEFFRPAPGSASCRCGALPRWSRAGRPGSAWGSAYGYLPSASHLVVQPGRVDERGFADATPHRHNLPSPYNAYSVTTGDPAYDPAHEDLLVLFRPLFYTSFMLADQLQDNDFFGAEVLAFSSASSKTAYSAAHLLAGRAAGRRAHVAGNVDFTAGLGVYDEVLSYDDVTGLDPACHGVPGRLRQPAGRLGGARPARRQPGARGHHRRHVAAAVRQQGRGAVLRTRPDAQAGEDWGHEGLDRAFAEAWHEFVPVAAGWVDVVTSTAPRIWNGCGWRYSPGGRRRAPVTSSSSERAKVPRAG